MVGCAFIINDEVDRPGSLEDVNRLTTTLQSIGCQVTDWSQEVRTREDLLKKANELTSEEKRDFFKSMDYVILIYMSHASNDGRAILGDEYCYLKRYILNPLFKINELDGKLKWTCRGVQKTQNAHKDTGSQPRKFLGRIQFIPSLEKYWRNYYLLSWATSEGSPAARTDEGSPYITQLCEQLKIGGRGLRTVLESTATVIREDPGLRQTPGYEFHFPEGNDFSFTTGFYQVDA